jgi:hypothetical protein
MLVVRPKVALLGALALLTSCTQGPDRPDKEAPPPPPRPLAQGASSASAAPSPDATASASASASAAAAPGTLTGAWEGRYEAKKGTIELPPKVKDKARAADDGKALQRK